MNTVVFVVLNNMSYCSSFQHDICNATGILHLDLFPLNNETLQVDIYKGVRLHFHPQAECHHFVFFPVIQAWSQICCAG